MAAQPWLDVSFGEKEAAKAAGARWDPRARRWYAPRPGIPELARWLPRPPIPAVLPGEDRAFGAGLFVDLVCARPDSDQIGRPRRGGSDVRDVDDRTGCRACR